jgi:hypothetical protein
MVTPSFLSLLVLVRKTMQSSMLRSTNTSCAELAPKI